METSPALLRDRSFLRRLGVTLAVLAVYRLGCWIPLPGIELSALMTNFGLGSMSSSIERLSIFAIGVTPLLSMLLLIELAMIIWPPFRAWAARSASNAGNLDGWIVAGTLALAAFQANGIAVGLEGIGALVPSPGLTFRAGVIVTLVAATAFLVWMASLVTRRGLGSGFLLLLAAPLLMAVPVMLYSQAAAWGPASELSIPLTLVFLAAATAGLVAAAVQTPSLASNGQLFWPPILAYAAVGWLILLMLAFAAAAAAAAWQLELPVLMISRETIEAVLQAFRPGQTVRLLVLPLLTLAFYFWRARSLAVAGQAAPAAGSWVAPTVLVAVVAATELVMTSLPAPLSLDGRSIAILVAFALSVLMAVRALQQPSTERGS